MITTAEGRSIEEMTVSNCGELRKSLTKAEKKKLTKDARKWLLSNRDNPQDCKKAMENKIKVAIPVDGPRPGYVCFC